MFTSALSAKQIRYSWRLLSWSKTASSSLPFRRTWNLGSAGITNLDEVFGTNQFGEKQMQQRLPEDVYKRFKTALSDQKKLDDDIADIYAGALKDWAISKGVTHYAHWFLPLTGLCAEKHDSFLKPTGLSAVSKFTGKQLIQGEPDGSSFPSGGLRQTHEARGYTVWDPSSPPFIMDTGSVPTLFIPTCFVSWKGHALDKKTPMLRANQALNAIGKKLLHDVLGDTRHTAIHVESGVEQEFFLIHQDHFRQRPDLKLSGRSIVGAHPSKGQELSDQYFRPLPSKSWECISEIEKALWAVGIPITTRHREVAPNQYELAPIFSQVTVAVDQNVVMMELMQRIAARYGLTVLLHEKPFAGVNGSGKHNNWSLGSKAQGTFFAPGSDPLNNIPFLLSLAAIIRGVHVHGDLLRWSIASSGNDHRLGANEAPPGIMSIYVGDELQAIIDALLVGKPVSFEKRLSSLGVDTVPMYTRDFGDRNRTSPVAFTGNKFEVRAVGASQNTATSNTVLALLMADSFQVITEKIQALLDKGETRKSAALKVAGEIINAHKAVIFNGNGYSQEWRDEAARRGLPNLASTVDVLEAVRTEDRAALFAKYGVLSREEFDATINVDEENLAKQIEVEGQTMLNMANRMLIPASLKYCAELGSATNGPAVRARGTHLSKLADEAVGAADALQVNMVSLGKLLHSGDTGKAARFAHDVVRPAMSTLREPLDALELLVDKNLWPIPTYEEMLFEEHS